MNVRVMIGKWYGGTLAMILLCIVTACDDIELDTWDRTYPSSAVAECVFETSDGDIISSGIDRTDSTLTVLCADRLGVVKWERTFSPVIGFRNSPSSVVRQTTGGYLVAYLNPQDLSLTAVTLDSTGETSGGWILPTGFHRIWSFDATENGFLVSGATECDFYSTENPNVCSDISPFNNVTTLFSDSGEILWSVEGPYYWKVKLTRDGGAVCMGTDLSTQTEKTRYGLVVKRGPDGSILWSTPIKTVGLLLNTFTTPVSIDETDDGGVIYTARYGFNMDYFNGSMVSRITKTGSVTGTVYSKDYYANSVRQAKDGGYIVSGKKCSSYRPGVDIVVEGAYIRKLSAGLSKEWQRDDPVTDTEKNKEIHDAASTDDGGFILCGTKTTGPFWIMKTDNLGRISTTADKS